MSVLLILQDWAEFALRWLHVVVAIFWVGLALGFLRLNLNIKSSRADVWRAADDGFFLIARDMNVPPQAQPQIGWFRWEAYVTWLSGLALMTLHYFLQADLYLIDPTLLPLTTWQAIAIALAGLVVGWLGYDQICKAPWSETARRIAIFVFLAALAFALTRLLSGRGAFIEFGAVIGTIMAANVAHVLVPNQRRMLEAVRKGEAPDEKRFAASRQRALHNNYLSVPVVFLMLSNHYPLAFASRFNWLIAALSLVVGGAIRHYYIARHRGQGDLWWTWALAAAGAVAIVLLSLAGAATHEARAEKPRNAMEALDAAIAPRFADVQGIVTQRCVVCHMKTPLWSGMAAAPKGVRLDTPDLIRSHARDIARQAVWTSAMPPPGAEIGMTHDERHMLAAWLSAGAPAH